MAVLGMWMWPGSVEQCGAAQTVSRCARAGVTDVFFLAKGMAGTTAFHGSVAPTFSERDLLRELTDEAHRQGIRVHAWFTSACDAHYKQLHPQSGRFHYLRGRDRELISLTDEGYLTYMEEIVRQVYRTYDVDGLHLDYIRYNHLMYGWAPEDLGRYKACGADISCLKELLEATFVKEKRQESAIFDAFRAEDESVLALARARRGDVVRFAQRLISAAQAEKSGLILSAALMPEGAYDDPAFADLHYGQNYEDAAQLYHWALPMAYSQAYGQDAPWVRQVAEGCAGRGLKTIIGLQAYEGGTGLTLQKDLQAVKDAPVEGVCLFREGAHLQAFAENGKLQLHNPTQETVTSIQISARQERCNLPIRLETDETRDIALPFEPETVQAFSGESEHCVYLIKH